MSTLFKGVHYYWAIPVNEHTIQGSTVIKGAYYLRKYGSWIYLGEYKLFESPSLWVKQCMILFQLKNHCASLVFLVEVGTLGYLG